MLTVAQIYAKLTKDSPSDIKGASPLAGPGKVEQPIQRVLIVDDSPVNQKMLRTTLLRILPKCKCVLANDGFDALTKFKEAAQPFDLVLMDLEMPIMDGQTATTEIRKSPQGSVTPIVCVSSCVNSQEELDRLAAGMNGFLAKPICKENLERLVKKYGCSPGLDVSTHRREEEKRAGDKPVPSAFFSPPRQSLWVCESPMHASVPAIKSPRSPFSLSSFGVAASPPSGMSSLMLEEDAAEMFTSMALCVY